MNLRFAPRITVVLLLCGLHAPQLCAEEGSEELARARMTFEKEMDFSTRPIRDRYLSRLESLKRSLGSRGDARGAAAVQDEIDRVKGMALDPTLARYVGTWKIAFTNGETRRYTIALDGSVIYDEQAGKKLATPVKGKLTMKGSEALLDFQDGAIQKIKLSGKTLLIELFSAKDGNSEGPPVAKATGTAG